MIVDGVWIGENISVNPFDLPKADRKLIDGELSLYSEWTLPNDRMSWKVPVYRACIDRSGRQSRG